VFAAGADVEAWLTFATLAGAELDQCADALLVDRGEEIVRVDTFVEIARQEGADVVAREAAGELGQIVGADFADQRHRDVGLRFDTPRAQLRAARPIARTCIRVTSGGGGDAEPAAAVAEDCIQSRECFGLVRSGELCE
jgi:hypothetical protein